MSSGGRDGEELPILSFRSLGRAPEGRRVLEAAPLLLQVTRVHHDCSAQPRRPRAAPVVLTDAQTQPRRLRRGTGQPQPQRSAVGLGVELDLHSAFLAG